MRRIRGGRGADDGANAALATIWRMPGTSARRAYSPLLIVVASLFVATLVAANIMAVKVATLGPLTVTGAIVIFPLAYLFGDVLTEVWGYSVARVVIWSGFLANAVVVGFVALAIALPAAPAFADEQGAYSQILGSTPRLVAASFAAYLAGEFLNSFILARLKVATGGRHLWMRTIGSTLVGQGVDSLIFVSLAFAGMLPGSVIWTIIRDLWLVKVLYEIAATPLTYAIVNWLKRVEGVDTFDTDTNFAPIVLRGRRRSLTGVSS